MIRHGMSEMRYDPIQKRWVIIAPERSGRPDDFAFPNESDFRALGRPRLTEKQRLRYQTGTPDTTDDGSLDDLDNLVQSVQQVDYKESCPFCIGNEAMTPPEIIAIRPSDDPAQSDRSSDARDWRIRVVPNSYPALRVEPDDLDRSAVGLYDRMNGIGAHEVVIETPEHNVGMADLSLDHLTDIFRIYRDRMTDLIRDQRLRQVLIFKNHRSSAGASLAHSHSQIIATPIIPTIIATELESTRAHYRDKERCLICDIIQQEVSCGDRIIYDDGAFIVFAPYASRFPFELMIIPRSHSHQYGDITDEYLPHLARCMHTVLNRLNRSLGDPPFNFVIHTAPNVNGSQVHSDRWASLRYDYHWYIEIFPRLTGIAGFECGTGFHINPTPPEEAAEFLRKTL